MTLSSSLSPLSHEADQRPYCHNPYAIADAPAPAPHPSGPAEQRAYCHNPYTLPQCGGQSWEQMWATSLPSACPTEAQPSPFYDDSSSSTFSPSTSNDSLHSFRPASAYSPSTSNDSLHSFRPASAYSPSTSNDSLCSIRSGVSASSDATDGEPQLADLPGGCSAAAKAVLSGPLSSSRFPVSVRGRCHHRDFWLRLRGKRGYTYFLCTHCMCGWRKPRDVQAPSQN
eukprot:EG_transcript_15316